MRHTAGQGEVVGCLHAKTVAHIFAPSPTPWSHMQGLDVIYRVPVRFGQAFIFSGHELHGGVAGPDSGEHQHRVHVYFGQRNTKDTTYPLDYDSHHVESMVKRFTIKQ